ncbi:MAG: hypothetical protein N2204_06985 [Anaerolineae bacterium]|nr:hypothetical protein [Anaerolineae bacterium]
MLDYRDRASVLIWVVLMGLAAQRFLELPPRTWETEVLGSPVNIAITANTILGALLAALVASGVEAVVRVHPHLLAATAGTERLSGAVAGLPHGVHATRSARDFRPVIHARWMYWGLPIAVIVVAVLLLPFAPSAVYWALGLVATGIALGLSLAGLYHTIDPFQRGYRRARLGLNALTYAVALLLFLVVYRTRARSIISATEIWLVSSLLALELLRGTNRPTVLVALYAAIVGLVLGQATWVLNYWRLHSLTGGLVLLVLFYNVVGLAQHALQGRIRRRILVEYGLITLAAMALIWEFAP